MGHGYNWLAEQSAWDNCLRPIVIYQSMIGIVEVVVVVVVVAAAAAVAVAADNPLQVQERENRWRE